MKNQSWNIIIVDECDSTNSHIKRLKLNTQLYDRTALMTYFQLNGRGQGKNSWYSSKNKNLLASFYKEIELPVAKNFMITIIASLAIYRLLKKHKIECNIKWPNDIYYNNKKIAGILIENSIIRNLITNTTIGIGLNINEENFPDWIPSACSMQQIVNKTNKSQIICNELLNEFDILFGEFDSTDGSHLYNNYVQLLFRLNEWHLFKKEGDVFNGRIHGVKADGRLILESEKGELLHLLFGEIQYVI